MPLTWITSSRLGAPMVFPYHTLSLPAGARAGVCREPRQDAAKNAIKQNSNKFKDPRGQFLPPDPPHLFGAILFGAPRPVNYCTLVLKRFRASISLPQITPIWEDFWTHGVQSLSEGTAENWTAFRPSEVPLKYSNGAGSRLRSTSRADRNMHSVTR